MELKTQRLTTIIESLKGTLFTLIKIENLPLQPITLLLQTP